MISLSYEGVWACYWVVQMAWSGWSLAFVDQLGLDVE
jgi:hypothetical protein